MTNISNTLKVSEIKRGQPTVTVYCVDGSSFEAPAKGPVLSSDYVPSQEQMDMILQTNLERASVTPEELVITFEDGSEHTAQELLERDKAIKEIEASNRSYYNKLPRYFDYDRKGNKKNTRKSNHNKRGN